MSFNDYIKRSLRFIIKGVPNKTIIAKINCIAPSEQLCGKKIIITGGGRGLGLSMAKVFVDNGAQVLIAGRNEETLKKSAEEIKCKYLKIDLQHTNSFSNFLVEANEALGGANVLVNNAGISLHEKDYLAVTKEQYDEQINTNFKGPFFLTQVFIEMLMHREDHSGKVLFVSSETSMTADDRPYGLTKAAINSLVQGLAYRYIKEGIRVNAIAPGITASNMTGLKADGNLYYSGNATERVYLPEEVAEIAKFLISDASNLINGQILVCNEGNTINARWK